jgi:phosphoglycerate dehydrogenase-like enzyme
LKEDVLVKIVVTDPVILPEDYRQKLRTLGQLEIRNSMPRSFTEFIETIKDAEILLVGEAAISREVFQYAAKLELICVCHTGSDNVDVVAATDHGVVVSNVPNYASEAVAEFVFALAMDLMRKIEVADSLVHKNEFDCHYYFSNRLLAGKTLGVVGAGNIGKRVIQIGHSFDMNVIAATAHPSSRRMKELGTRFVPLNNLLSESDIVTLHLPLTPETAHMIGAKELDMMKPTAILINTSRGKIINEEALIDALRKKKIAGAALDVFERESLSVNDPLLKAENLVLTPHIAYLSEETIDKCAKICIENVEMFLKDKPQNVVNPSVLMRRLAGSTTELISKSHLSPNKKE